MKVERRWFTTMVIALLPLLLVTNIRGDQGETKFQWVIISVAPAFANDDSKIIVTGTGTFEPSDPEEVTGGGTWQTVAPNGITVTGSGTFRVTRLVKFDLAPGAISNPAIHAGLVFLRISYSDGSRGILVVSCHLPGTPATVFEGATASKGFVDYWKRVPAGAFFRALTENED